MFVCFGDEWLLSKDVWQEVFFAAKLGYSEQKDRLKDLSRECAQKAADMKNFTSLRKDPDRGPRKESGRQRGTI